MLHLPAEFLAASIFLRAVSTLFFKQLWPDPANSSEKVVSFNRVHVWCRLNTGFLLDRWKTGWKDRKSKGYIVKRSRFLGKNLGLHICKDILRAKLALKLETHSNWKQQVIENAMDWAKTRNVRKSYIVKNNCEWLLRRADLDGKGVQTINVRFYVFK
mgnify:CR=1 FL=1